MSMTESEAKFWLDKLHGNILRDKFVETCTENEIIALIESKIAWTELEQYRAIGTVSEFAKLKKKATATAKKPKTKKYVCPNCKRTLNVTRYDTYCEICCGRLYVDWSEGKE